MAKFSFNFELYRNDEVILESTAEVSLTKKDFAEIEQFIIDHNYSGEFVDIPTHLYDKCSAKAFEVAMKQIPPHFELDEDCFVELEALLPENFLNQLSAETIQKVKEKMEFYND